MQGRKGTRTSKPTVKSYTIWRPKEPNRCSSPFCSLYDYRGGRFAPEIEIPCGGSYWKWSIHTSLQIIAMVCRSLNALEHERERPTIHAKPLKMPSKKRRGSLAFHSIRVTGF